MIHSIFADAIERHYEVFRRLCLSDMRIPFAAAVNLLTDRTRRGGKILICGNGGSAADAQHLAAEFVIRYRKNREPIPAIALTADTSVITAAYNDGYEVFGRQIRALGKVGDILIAISTSGTSDNIIDAIRHAKMHGMSVIGLTGQHGFRDTQQPHCSLGVDVELRVPSDVTCVIQEMHILIYHALVEALEYELR